MQNKTNHLVKDIYILNEQLIADAHQTITLITGDSPLTDIATFTVSNPYKMDKLTTFSIPDRTAAHLQPANAFNSARNIVKSIRNGLLNIYNAYCATQKFNTNVFDLRNIEPNNMAHLVIHAIPLCLLVKNSAGADTQFLFKKMAAPFEKLLNEFGIHPITSNKKIEATFIKIFATRHVDGHAIQLAGHNFVEATNCLHSSILPNTYAGYQFKSPLKNKHKIFIARRGARALINHNEVNDLLNSHGYETVFMEDYSIPEQLGIASEATHLVGVHGASMGMLVLNKHIEGLIEILPPNAYNDYFAIALAGCAKQHIQVIPSVDTRVLYNGWAAVEHFKNQPFSILLDQLKLALDKVEG